MPEKTSTNDLVGGNACTCAPPLVPFLHETTRVLSTAFRRARTGEQVVEHLSYLRSLHRPKILLYVAAHGKLWSVHGSTCASHPALKCTHSAMAASVVIPATFLSTISVKSKARR